MILTTLVLAAGIIIGVGLLIKYWNNLTAYLKKLAGKLQEFLRSPVEGFRLFLRNAGDFFVEKTVNYSKIPETTRWKETVVTRNIPENQVANEFKQRATLDEEFDITDEYEQVLTNNA